MAHTASLIGVPDPRTIDISSKKKRKQIALKQNFYVKKQEEEEEAEVKRIY